MPNHHTYVELRVHGVSGTPPTDLLGTTEVEEVAGDSFVRFVRPTSKRKAKPSKGPPRGGVLEGMSWGGLTSGAAAQAAWIVMLPFALVNLAFFTSPALEREGSGSRAWIRGWVFRASARLLALSVTVLVTLAAALVSMDLVAWQCADGRCPALAERLAFAEEWSAGSRVALAALVPVLVLAAVAWLSHRVSLRYEATSTSDVAAPEAEPPDGSDDPARADDTAGERRTHRGVDQPDLFSPLMWHGEPLVQRLRGVHLAVGWATVALLLTWSADLVTAEAVPRAAAGMWWAAALLGSVTILTGVVLTVAPTRWAAWTFRALRYQGATTMLLQVASLLAVVLGALAFQRTAGAASASTMPPALPALVHFVTLVMTVQVVTLVVMAVVLGRRRHPSGARPSAAHEAAAQAPTPGGRAGSPTPPTAARTHPITALRRRRYHPPASARPATTSLPALRGLAPVVIAASGVLLGYVYSAGLALRMADVIGAPAEEGGASTELVIPSLMRWAAAGFGVIVVLLLGAAMWSLWLVSRRSVADLLAVVDDFVGPLPATRALGGEHPADLRRERYLEWRDDYRIRRIVRARRLQRMVQARTVTNVLAAGGLLGMVIAVLAIVANFHLVNRLLAQVEWFGIRPAQGAVLTDEVGVYAATPTPGGWLATSGERLAELGSWALVALAGAFVAVLVAGLRSAAVRRRVGITWDVVCFWPRGCHPFAPPSYTERAVPQLIARTRFLARDAGPTGLPGVVISAHSQGSVLAAAVVAQLHTLENPDDAQWDGMPLPAAQGTLDRVALLTHGGPLGRLYEPLFPRYFGGATVAADGTVGPSPNLVRVRDALDGRWVNLWRDTDPIGSSVKRVLDRHDLQCTDPDDYLLDEEDARYPTIHGHSAYLESEEYPWALKHLTTAVSHDLQAPTCAPPAASSPPAGDREAAPRVSPHGSSSEPFEP